MDSTSLPLTYAESRDGFRWTARHAGRTSDAYPIAARGPDGGDLTIDVVTLGAVQPSRVLVVLSGVHGVEGFVNSAIQCEALDRFADLDMPDDVGVVFVHAVNPWGMAWWRRQNESNVDLNRNWGRDEWTPPPNARYAQLHDALCPAGHAPPDAESLLERTRSLIDAHGYSWVKAAVSEGQYDHPDGLYFGGNRTEESNRVMEAIASRHLGAASEVLAVDLHTGHGPFGEMTVLTHCDVGSDEDRWLSARLGELTLESTQSHDASSPPKHGQIVRGLAASNSEATWRSITPEMGTVSDTTMILAERSEHWVHLHGDRQRPDHAAIVWHHRTCSTPDDPTWTQRCLEHGRTVLDKSLAAVID